MKVADRLSFEERSRKVYRDAFLRGLHPDPILTVSEWADAHRWLSKKSSSEHGQWRTARTPYLREIMDCLSTSSPVRKVVLKKGSQIGGTEVGNNLIGYVIDHAPGPMLVIFPTDKAYKRQVKQRIDPLIAESPRLADKVHNQKGRGTEQTLDSKSFPGGVLFMGSAKSASDLRSMPARVLFLDEIDAYDDQLKDEGDPVDLAERALRTFPSSYKEFVCSTPTAAGRSRISKEFQLTD